MPYDKSRLKLIDEDARAAIWPSGVSTAPSMSLESR